MPELGGASGEVEALRHDTDDRHGYAAERERSAEHVRIAAESALPHPIAEHDDVVLSRRILILAKAASKRRRNLEQLEEIPRHGSARDPLGVPAFGERRTAVIEGGDSLEHGVLTAPIEEVSGCHGKTSVLGNDLVHEDETVGIREGQRPEEHTVDDAEDGRCGADAERQRENRDDCKGGVRHQLSHGVAHVAQYVGEHLQLLLDRGASPRRTPHRRRSRGPRRPAPLRAARPPVGASCPTGGFAPPDPPSPSLAGTPLPRSAPARACGASCSNRGFAPPDPPSPSLAGLLRPASARRARVARSVRRHERGFRWLLVFCAGPVRNIMRLGPLTVHHLPPECRMRRTSIILGLVVCIAVGATLVGVAARSDSSSQPAIGQAQPPVSATSLAGRQYGRLVIRNAMLINGRGTPTEGPMDIVIDKDTIADIIPTDGVSIRSYGPNWKRPEGDRVIDAAGMYVIPGLVDMHTHVPGTRRGGADQSDYA